MTTTVETKLKLEKKIIRDHVSNNFWLRMLGEFLSAFILIFTINFIISLGEEGIPFFKQVSNINFTIALWIGSMTFLSFLWSQRTSLSANFINLIMTYRNKQISAKDFYTSIPFQLIGGIMAAMLVYVIAGFIDYDHITGTFDPNWNELEVMGGTIPKIKGLWTADGQGLLTWAPVDLFHEREIDVWTYAFAAFQGTINATLIVVSFTLNTFADRKYNNGKESLAIRYIILVVGISITTIFYANTTNWVRLFAPAVVSTIKDPSYAPGGGSLMLTTTITYIAFQMIGIIAVLNTKYLREEI